MTDWVDTWDHEALHAGVPGKGALDAWLKTALIVEHNTVNGYHTAGGSIDIYKCFDQINRKLIYKLALRAGMPRRVLDPYLRYIDNLVIKYQVGRTIGSPHKERCSIPQGCPFSMAMVALLMRPWVAYMETLDVVPRCLADDLLFTTHVVGHRARSIRAMKASWDFPMI